MWTSGHLHDCWALPHVHAQDQVNFFNHAYPTFLPSFNHFYPAILFLQMFFTIIFPLNCNKHSFFHLFHHPFLILVSLSRIMQRWCKIHQDLGEHFHLNTHCFGVNPFHVAILRFCGEKYLYYLLFRPIL